MFVGVVSQPEMQCNGHPTSLEGAALQFTVFVCNLCARRCNQVNVVQSEMHSSTLSKPTTYVMLVLCGIIWEKALQFEPHSNVDSTDFVLLLISCQKRSNIMDASPRN